MRSWPPWALEWRQGLLALDGMQPTGGLLACGNTCSSSTCPLCLPVPHMQNCLALAPGPKRCCLPWYKVAQRGSLAAAHSLPGVSRLCEEVLGCHETMALPTSHDVLGAVRGAATLPC